MYFALSTIHCLSYGMSNKRHPLYSTQKKVLLYILNYILYTLYNLLYTIYYVI